jgi:predicted  nucleic acid-binding Zn-ribbon protein
VKKIIVYNHPGGCKDLLQAKEKELDRIKSRLETREREIRRLKHQIDSLEAIHLKFQERKQGASSP